MRWRDAPVLSAALAAGVVQAASFWPFSAWWLQLLALGALVALLLRNSGIDAETERSQVPGHHETPGAAAHRGTLRAAWLGFAFGIGWFACGVSWLYISMHRYGGMPALLAATALLLFSALLAALFVPVTAALTHADRAMRARSTSSNARVASLALLFAGLWSLAEIARGWLFTGFPWLAIGYAHVDGPLIAFAPVFGVHGVSAFAALCAFGVGAALSGLRADAAPAQHGNPTGRAAKFIVGAGFAFVPLLAGTALRSPGWSAPYGTPLSVRLLQGNVPQELKFDPARALLAMNAYAANVLRGDAALTVLPETAWTIPWSGTPATLRAALRSHLAGSGGVVAIGMPLLAEAGDAVAPAAPMLTNSVAVIDRSGEIVYRYDKRHLVPFGEFVPFGFGWFVDLMRIPLGDFARGSSTQAPLDVGGQRVAFDICYEDLFGEELAAQVRGGATILANVSNIAWFGDSHALPQHLQIARMRAIELARPMLRATNTGVTAAIDADGRVIGELPSYTSGSLELTVQGYDGLTPYARLGNRLPIVLAVVLAGAGACGSLRMTRRTNGRRAQTR